ncbi:TPA: hypothetical protein ACH3X1_000309 [Trebouxia sp. C0004]
MAAAVRGAAAQLQLLSGGTDICAWLQMYAGGTDISARLQVFLNCPESNLASALHY